MNNGVNIKQLESLKDLKNAFLRFRSEATQSLNRVNYIHSRIHQELEKKLMSEQIKLDRLSRTYSNSISPEAHTIRVRLSEIRKAISEFEEQISIYQKFATRMQKIISQNMLQAQIFLHNKIIEAEAYVAVSMKGKSSLTFKGSHHSFSDSSDFPKEK